MINEAQASERPDDADIVSRVSDELARRGHDVTYEYPGFICLHDQDGTCWNTGDINETWTLDHTSDDGGEMFANGGDTDLPTTCENVSEIADAIERHLREAKATTKGIAN